MTSRVRLLAGTIVSLAALGTMSAPARAADPVVAAITVEPAAGHVFPDQAVGAYSLPRSVGIRSAGTTTATIEEIRFVGPDANDFSLDVLTPCARELEATYSCSFPIFFAPKSVGPKSARLEVISNSFEGPVSIPVSGVGTPEALPDPVAPRVSFVAKPKRRIVIRGGRLARLAVKFRSDQAGSSFRCSVNGGKFTACRSPKVLTKLKPGRHTIAIQAVKGGLTSRTERASFTVVRKR